MGEGCLVFLAARLPTAVPGATLQAVCWFEAHGLFRL
jgi:hypothetical protein